MWYDLPNGVSVEHVLTGTASNGKVYRLTSKDGEGYSLEEQVGSTWQELGYGPLGFMKFHASVVAKCDIDWA
jgi:hypothetical protein